MNFIYLICFILLVAGTAFILKLNSEQMTKDLSFLFNRKKSLRDKSLTATGKKKSRKITVELQKIRTALEETGKQKQLSVAIAASVILMIGGAVAAVMMHNPFLIPVLAVAFAMLPFAYLMRTIAIYESQVKGEMETALSIITTSYVRSDNIISAVSENIRHLKPPLRGIFESFVAEATTITPDVRVAIMHMRDKISDTIFEEWCDTLVTCQNDRTLKDTLMPVVSKLTDVRLVNNSLKTMLSEVRREYYMMVAMVVANIPLLYCLNKDWYNALMNTVFGKIVLAICGVVIVVTFFKMNKYTKPVEYKR